MITGLALLVFASWYAYLTGNLPDRGVMPNTPGPAFFPTIISGAIFVLAAGLVVQGFTEGRSAEAHLAEPGENRNAIAAICAFLTYLAALPYAGFIVASVPFFAVLMFLYGSRNRVMMGIASIVFPVALYIVFRHGFQIILPRGILAF